MPAYPSNHYHTPATYVLATKNPRTQLMNYELVHYDQPADAPSNSVTSIVALAAARELSLYDKVYFADSGRWMSLSNAIYMEEMTAARANLHPSSH